MVYLYPFAYAYTFIPNTINIIVAIIYIYWIGISSPLIRTLPGTRTTYCIYIYTYIHMHIHANVYTHIWLYVNVYLYSIYIHTHIYIYTHRTHTRYQTRFLRGPHLEQVKYNVHCSLFWERCPCLIMGRFFLQYHCIRPNNPPQKCNSIGVYKKIEQLHDLLDDDSSTIPGVLFVLSILELLVTIHSPLGPISPP
jgi:hypothetical protein